MIEMNTKEADKLLKWAEEKNPGPWISHSMVVADAAKSIAEVCGMNASDAYIFGLLHDIGRYAGVSNLKHVFDGYMLMNDKGYKEAAQICLTHSFPSKIFEEYSGISDCSPQESEILKKELAECVFSDYDRLIQLCDSISLPSGVCLLEKRLVDVAMRHGNNSCMIKKWQSLYDHLNYFNRTAGRNIYSLFPKIINNTFDF